MKNMHERPVQEKNQRKAHQFLFNFPRKEKPVTINFVETEHIAAGDTNFIQENLAQITPDQTLFIEQGSTDLETHVLSQIEELTKRKPEINEKFNKIRREAEDSSEESIFNYYDPFAEASKFTVAKGNRVINMDLMANISPKAVTYLVEKTGQEFTFEYIYDQFYIVFQKEPSIIVELMKDLFPMLTPKQLKTTCDKLHEIYNNDDSRYERQYEIEEFSDYIRERYMYKILEEQARDNDYVVCHPIHAQRLRKQPDQIVPPSQPENVFTLEG